MRGNDDSPFPIRSLRAYLRRGADRVLSFDSSAGGPAVSGRGQPHSETTSCLDARPTRENEDAGNTRGWMQT